MKLRRFERRGKNVSFLRGVLRVLWLQLNPVFPHFPDLVGGALRWSRTPLGFLNKRLPLARVPGKRILAEVGRLWPPGALLQVLHALFQGRQTPL
jgi:hypothetical protein